MLKLPFDDQAFDAIVSAYAMDYLGRNGARTALAEAHRVLKPGATSSSSSWPTTGGRSWPDRLIQLKRAGAPRTSRRSPKLQLLLTKRERDNCGH